MNALLSKLGVKVEIANPACFLEDRNIVVIGSDLTAMAAVIGPIAAQNAQLLRNLQLLEGRLGDQLRKTRDNALKSGLSNGEVNRQLVKVRVQFQRRLDAAREAVRRSEQQMDLLFKQSAGQMLVRLYHESFHAYIRNWVFPRPQYDIPPWLDEGLAVLFEGGQLECNSLRVDVPNPAALKKLKADLAGPDAVGMAKLLAAGKQDFLILAGGQHGRGSSAAAERYYTAAWGLAYYLTFEKRLLASPRWSSICETRTRRLPRPRGFSNYQPRRWRSSSTSGGSTFVGCKNLECGDLSPLCGLWPLSKARAPRTRGRRPKAAMNRRTPKASTRTAPACPARR